MDQSNVSNTIESQKNVGFVIDDGHIETLGEFLSPEVLFEDLQSRVRKYHPSDDLSVIERANSRLSRLKHRRRATH